MLLKNVHFYFRFALLDVNCPGDMKLLSLVLAAMFFAFALLQVNDPDPIVWISIYGAMVLVCAMAAFGRFSRPAMIILSLIYIIHMAFLWHGVADWYRSPNPSRLFSEPAKMDYPYIEETREFMGLMICLAALAFEYTRSRKTIARS
jgi:hypothetical protein